MQRLLSVRPADVGRSISEIRLQLSIENIEPVLNEVLETLGTRELEVQDREGRWNLLRVRPCRTSENNTDVRQISHRLHPAILQELGLAAALKAMVQEFGERENMPATYASENLPPNWHPRWLLQSIELRRKRCATSQNMPGKPT